MEGNLKRILNTVLGMIVFMFLAFSAIAILSSERTPDATAELAAEKEPVPRELPAGTGPEAVGEDALAAITEQPRGWQ